MCPSCLILVCRNHVPRSLLALHLKPSCSCAFLQLWIADFGSAVKEAAVSWGLILVVLVLPMVAVGLMTTLPLACARQLRAGVHAPDSFAMQALGPLVAPFRWVAWSRIPDSHLQSPLQCQERWSLLH